VVSPIVDFGPCFENTENAAFGHNLKNGDGGMNQRLARLTEYPRAEGRREWFCPAIDYADFGWPQHPNFLILYWKRLSI